MATLKLVAEHAGADGWSYDPWGTAINLAFDVAEVLDAADLAGDMTPELFARWEYRPSPHVVVPSLESLAADEETVYGAAGLAQALLDGDITHADLIYAGNVLDRYCRLLVAAGKDW